jgi:hypothetical protein
MVIFSEHGRFVISKKNLVDLVVLAVIASAPISIPTGLAGGVFAAWATGRERHGQRFSGWVVQGGLWGFLLGALGTTLYFACVNFGTVPLLLLLAMTPIGGFLV